MIQAGDWSAMMPRLGVATLFGLKRQWSGHDGEPSLPSRRSSTHIQ
jgi:hypothetical protein